MIPPPAYRTIERCIALIPEGWAWAMFSPYDQRSHFAFRISAPDWDRTLFIQKEENGVRYLAANEQPHANFWGKGETAMDALVDALELMEKNR